MDVYIFLRMFINVGSKVGAGSEPGEVKHLSTRRRRNQKRFPK